VVFGKKLRLQLLLANLPDIAMTVLFAFSAIMAATESVLGEFLARELSLWFIYELIGAFFLLLWVAVNEERHASRNLDLLRFVSTCAVYLCFALVMHFVYHASLACVTISAVGGFWALLSPLVREDEPSVFKLGREAAVTVLTLIASFFVVAFFASLAEHAIPRPFNRATFDSVTLMVIGFVYYLLRWRLVVYFASRGTA
jgi:hypothetical protein